MVAEDIVFPLNVNVLPEAGELNVIVPVYVLFMPLAIVNEPAIFNVELPANVPVYPVKFKLLVVAAAFTVEVPAPEFALKNTSSEAVGRLAPPAPPEERLQCAVSFQFPVPPIQYLSIASAFAGDVKEKISALKSIAKRKPSFILILRLFLLFKKENIHE